MGTLRPFQPRQALECTKSCRFLVWQSAYETKASSWNKKRACMGGAVPGVRQPTAAVRKPSACSPDTTLEHLAMKSNGQVLRIDMISNDRRHADTAQKKVHQGLS